MNMYRHAIAQVYPIYTCDRCKLSREGGRKVEVLIRVGEVVPKPQCVPAYMPVGWASFYRVGENYFLCPQCLETLS